MVLTTLLKILDCEVIGIHINYNNRKETSQEQAFLEKWCNYNGIKLYVKTIKDLKRENTKRSDYEVITKKIRFDFYKEIMLFHRNIYYLYKDQYLFFLKENYE